MTFKILAWMTVAVGVGITTSANPSIVGFMTAIVTLCAVILAMAKTLDY
jgi:hypothetical protein